MQMKLVSRISLVTIPIVIVCGLMVAPSSLRVAASSPQTDDENIKACSNRTLHDDYGSAAEGVLLNIPGLPPEAQFRGLTMTHFDGNGNLTWVEHTVINGTPLQSGWTPASGVYTVNSHCTRTALVDTPNSPVPLHLPLIVARRGKEIHTVLDSDAISSVFMKVE